MPEAESLTGCLDNFIGCLTLGFTVGKIVYLLKVLRESDAGLMILKSLFFPLCDGTQTGVSTKGRLMEQGGRAGEICCHSFLDHF